MSWDGSDLLAKQAERLEGERDALRTAVEERTLALKKAEALRDGHAMAAAMKRRARLIFTVVFGALLLVGGGLAVHVYQTYVQSETWRGRVVEVRGAAPAAVDDACTIAIAPEYLPENASMRIDCGGMRLYGHESFGALQCETEEHRAISCEDANTIVEGGDPRLRFDRARQSLVLDDGSRWSITIALSSN